MEHVAGYLKANPEAVRRVNFLQSYNASASGQPPISAPDGVLSVPAAA